MKASMIARGILWVLAAAVLVFLLILTGAVWLLGVLIVIIALPFLSLAWNTAAAKDMEIRIMLPSGARKHMETRGSVIAAFRRLQPLGRVFCTVELANDLTGERTVLRLPLESSGGVYGALFRIPTDRCGRIRGLASQTVLADMFGFLPKKAQGLAEGHMTVLPETFPVAVDTAMLSAPKDGEDTRDDRKGSDMTETYELRDYRPGDNLHGIHWKLSGKLDKLIFREPAQPVSNALLLYWDQSCGTPDELDALAEAVFSVGQSLCQEGVLFTVGKTEQGVLRTAEITNTDDLIEHFPLLLRRVGGPQADIGALTVFGRVFYFTAEVPEGGGDESVQVFLCGRNPRVKGNEIVFTPETAEEVLAQL